MSLPKTVTKKMYVHLSEYSKGDTELFNCDMSDHGYTLLGPVEVTFDVPQVDVVAAQINSLEKVKAKTVSEYEHRLARINDKIQELRCLTQETA